MVALVFERDSIAVGRARRHVYCLGNRFQQDLMATAHGASGIDDLPRAVALSARGIELLPEASQRLAVLVRDRAPHSRPMTKRARQNVFLMRGAGATAVVAHFLARKGHIKLRAEVEVELPAARHPKSKAHTSAASHLSPTGPGLEMMQPPNPLALSPLLLSTKGKLPAPLTILTVPKVNSLLL